MAKRIVARRRFMKEGALATATLASALTTRGPARAQDQTAQTHQACSLAEFDLGDRQLDSLQFSRSLYAGHEPALGFSAKSRREALAWQKQVRARLTSLVGGFPARRSALKARVLEREDLGGYTREKIIFQSRDDLTVFGYLLLPEGQAGPVPAVICLPGHGRGCDDIVGIDAEGKQRSAGAGYQRDFALQTVERGYAAFAIEQLAFGCRRDAAARRKGLGQSSCQPAAGAALLFGQTMVGWRVWDVMRALDYLATRREIDSRRVATMGISGGGTVSLFSAALDERIKVSVVSGYFNTFRDSIMSLSHCIDNYIPGILNHVEMYDVAGLIAPRALFVESGTRDNIFPVEASRKAFSEARRIYSVFGAPEKTEQEIFDGEHVFHGRGAFAFLQKWL